MEASQTVGTAELPVGEEKDPVIAIPIFPLGGYPYLASTPPMV